MPIINSTYAIDASPQADGRRWVKETHTDHNGKTYNAEYLAADDFDYETCLQTRANSIGADIDRREAAIAEGSTGLNYRRIRPDSFRDRFTFSEKLRVKTSIDPVVQLFMDESQGRPYIDLDHTLVQQAMPYLRDNGILDGETAEARQARMEQILSDGTLAEI